MAFASNPKGDFVVIAGDGAQSKDAVIEGVNIIEAKCIIFNPNIVGASPGMGQPPGNDKVWGAKPNLTISPNMFPTMGKNILSSVILSEIPAWSKDVTQGRAKAEQGWLSDDRITVFATVYGWQRPSGGLWYRDQIVSVTSPMLIMKDEQLTAKSVTFIQSNQTGTRTILELCNANALGGYMPGMGK
jgi:hypothetical protein